MFKCNTCLKTYHLSCQKEEPAHVNKKKFKCEICVSKENVQVNKRRQSVAPTNSKTPSLDGFAGFSQEETTTKKTVKNSKKPLNRSKSSNFESEKCLQIDIGEETDIKEEPLTPTSKLEEILNEPETALPSSLESANDSTQSGMSTDPLNTLNEEMFAEQQKLNEGEMKKEVKDEKLTYNTKTRIIPHESIPDVTSWDCDEVYTYFLGTTIPEYAHLFKENGIDGYALLLLKRDDILRQFKLTLGSALRLYSHIVSLQYKNNNPVLAWEDF